jgi:hypothetical protein
MMPSDGQTYARIRTQDWEREMSALQLRNEASRAIYERQSAGYALGALLVDLAASLRAGLSRKRQSGPA